MVPLRITHLSFLNGFSPEMLRFFKYEYETPIASLFHWSQSAFRNWIGSRKVLKIMWGLIKNECKLIQILVQGRQFGEIAGQEGGAEQFPESAEFFPNGASENCTALRPSVLDGQVDQFLCPGKCPFRPGILACLESLQYAGCLAADVGHLLRERHLGPSAVFKGSVLHLSNNKLFDKPFDGFPDIRIQHIPRRIYEILALLFLIQVESP